MDTVTYKLTGIRPLIMHSGRLADPLDEKAQKLAELTAKRKKTESDHRAIADAEWEGGVYWNDEVGLHLPSENLDAMCQRAAAAFKLRERFKAAVMADDLVCKLDYAGPKSFAAVKADPRFRLRCGVVVSRMRIQRTRPMIPTGWSLTVSLTFDESTLNRKQVTEVVEHAGRLVGLGDWRPKFGRFTVEVVK